MAYFGSDEHGKWNRNIAQLQFGKHVENISSKYESAPKKLRAEGAEWYSKAHDEAVRIGRGDAAKGAGILAALSPLTHWSKNIEKADELVKTGTTTHITGMASVLKAQRINEGEDPTKVLGGNKVTSFYHNIQDPSNPHHVTIDRHAYDIALGRPFVGSGGGKREDRGKGGMAEELGLKSKGRYDHFKDAYTVASHNLGLKVPNQLQSATWVAHRGSTR